MSSFAQFYYQAQKERNKPVKHGKYKGQKRKVPFMDKFGNTNMVPKYYSQPSGTQNGQAPSASTFVPRG